MSPISHHQQQQQQSNSQLASLTRMLSWSGKSVALFGLLVLVLACSLSLSSQSVANVHASSIDDRQATLAVIESPEQVVRVLESLIRNIVYSANSNDIGSLPQKRGLDLGINRGFSGSQAGKHLMGLSAASFAGGPGR